MGCDIHMWAEVRDQEGVWQIVKAEQTDIDKEWESDYKYEAQDDPERVDEFRQSAMMHASQLRDEGRNYWLFGLLARVRIDDVPFNFGKPRGVPDDASENYRKIVKRWEGDGHSHTYFTLGDLVNWPFWHCPAAMIRDTEDPVMIARLDRFREHVQKMTEEERKAASKRWREDDDGEYPKIITRLMTYAELAGPFYRVTIPKLIRMGDDDAVRIVMFFDN